MSLQKIVVLCLALVVVGGGIWYLTSGTGNDSEGLINNDSSSVEQMEENEQTEMEAPSGFGSFASLFGLGQSITCDYSFSDDEGNSGSGTGYFANDKMRVDSTMQSEGQTFDSHMINDGEFTYVWTTSAEQSFAMKMPVEEFEQDDAPMVEEDHQQAQVSMDQEVEYDCDRWTADSLMFVPPADVEFTDMEAMMKQMMENMPEGFEMPEGMPMGY